MKKVSSYVLTIFFFFLFSRVISNIVSVTMGERFSKYVGGGVHPTTEVKLNQPLKITFVHEMAPQSQFYHPTCAYWSVSSHRWMTMGCKLLDTNR